MDGFPTLSTADKVVTFALGLIVAFSFWLLFFAFDFTHNQLPYRESLVLKLIRVFCFAYAVVSEAAVITLCFVIPHHALNPLDIVRCLVLGYWVVVLVLLGLAWRLSRRANLSLITLMSLLMGGLLLFADVFSATPDEDLDSVEISRLVVHATQTLMLLVLGVLELTFQATPLPLGRTDSTEPLLGYDQQRSSKDEEAGGGPSRLQMACKAFMYLRPTDNSATLRLVLCFTLVMLERGVNLAVPVLFKSLVDRLSEVGPLLLAARNASSHISQLAIALLQGMQSTSFWSVFYPWAFAYLCFYFLRGGSGSEGLLANIRDLLWIPITQTAFRRISLDVFQRLLDLDLQFHLHRKTGQVMRVLDRGTSSIQDTVSIILFNVVPQLVDIVLAVGYLAMHMQPWISVIVLVTVASYVPLTICITERRGKIRKKMNLLDNEREARATDMLLNYETVKYFCNERFELDNYDNATRQYQAAEYWQMAFLSLLSIVQSSVVWAGLASGMVVVVLGVARGQQTVGDLVLFVTMVNQLYVPLAFVGSYYRQVQKALIDMENMFELLETEPLVRDPPGGGTLVATAGRVEFSHVTFGYAPEAPVLRDVSFAVDGGHTMAVVGATGSGKSTVLRLLLRFYDPQAGAVLIDGTNIARVTQHSLRSALAVVPQDTVLFNDTIFYNIRYGRPKARDSEVYDAARVAHIHDAILTRFPQGYATRVGERGLRLSGGEKQRVAFARAVLKRPRILVLDEATSALDSLTEAQIQDSLAAMRSQCTTIIVAHRLSTIIDADTILVLDRGTVVESGSHYQLLEAGGQYAAMWARQQDSPDHAMAMMEGTPARSISGRRVGRCTSWQQLAATRDAVNGRAMLAADSTDVSTIGRPSDSDPGCQPWVHEPDADGADADEGADAGVPQAGLGTSGWAIPGIGRQHDAGYRDGSSENPIDSPRGGSLAGWLETGMRHESGGSLQTPHQPPSPAAANGHPGSWKQVRQPEQQAPQPAGGHGPASTAEICVEPPGPAGSNCGNGQNRASSPRDVQQGTGSQRRSSRESLDREAVGGSPRRAYDGEPGDDDAEFMRRGFNSQASLAEDDVRLTRQNTGNTDDVGDLLRPAPHAGTSQAVKRLDTGPMGRTGMRRSAGNSSQV